MYRAVAVCPSCQAHRHYSDARYGRERVCIECLRREQRLVWLKISVSETPNQQ